MLEVFGRRTSSSSLDEIWREFEGFRISFWGLFGVVNVLLRPHWLYRVLDLLVVCCLLGLGRWAYVSLSHSKRRLWDMVLSPGNAALAVQMLWVLAVYVSLIRWTSLTKAFSGFLSREMSSSLTPWVSKTPNSCSEIDTGKASCWWP